MRKLGLRKKPSGWYVTGMPVYYADGKPYTECGPYETKTEAQEDREGMQRHFDKEGWEDAEEPSKPEIRSKRPNRPKTVADRREEVQTEVEEQGLW